MFVIFINDLFECVLVIRSVFFVDIELFKDIWIEDDVEIVYYDLNKFFGLKFRCLGGDMIEVYILILKIFFYSKLDDLLYFYL